MFCQTALDNFKLLNKTVYHEHRLTCSTVHEYNSINKAILPGSRVMCAGGPWSGKIAHRSDSSYTIMIWNYYVPEKHQKHLKYNLYRM